MHKNCEHKSGYNVESVQTQNIETFEINQKSHEKLVSIVKKVEREKRTLQQGWAASHWIQIAENSKRSRILTYVRRERNYFGQRALNMRHGQTISLSFHKTSILEQGYANNSYQSREKNH